MPGQWIYHMLHIRNRDDAGHGGRIMPGAARGAGAGCPARVAMAVVDERPVALVFPASRRVVVDRLRRLLGADHVRMAADDEIDRIMGDPRAWTSRPHHVPPAVSLLMDASLLSARMLEVRSSSEEEPVRLAVEDWLASANPGLAFFTEPDLGREG